MFRFYGGVRKDLEEASSQTTVEGEAPGTIHWSRLSAMGATRLTLDVSACAVGDTVLLPITFVGMIPRMLDHKTAEHDDSQH
jgi:hypothetical protein